GIGFTVAGIIMLQGATLFSVQLTLLHVWGNLFILCAAASESVFSIISRRHRMNMRHNSLLKIHPMVQTLLVSAIAFTLAIGPAVWEKPLTAMQMIGLQEWLALVWYGLIVTALAFLFFYEGVKRCDAYTTAAFSGMIPMTSMLLSLFILKEPVGYAQWAGGFLIIYSMLLIGKNQNLKNV
ncbi:MAG: DMT family transporter, partial [Dethiobacteria bacterium]|nr:DMT family transporter [Dethiobacteria bacterium]